MEEIKVIVNPYNFNNKLLIKIKYIIYGSI